MTQTTTRPSDLLAPHDADDQDKVVALASSMREYGWIGAAVVVTGDQALTGSHRIAAADLADVDVPIIEIADLMAEHGQSWDELLADHDMGDGMGWYEAGRWLDHHLPAEVIAYYGLDLH